MDRGQKSEGLHRTGPARQAGISTEILRDADRIIRERIKEREKNAVAIPPLYAYLLGILTACGGMLLAHAITLLLCR